MGKNLAEAKTDVCKQPRFKTSNKTKHQQSSKKTIVREMVVQRSTIRGAGLGLFAARTLPKGHILSLPYLGKQLTVKEAQEIKAFRPSADQAYIFNLPKPVKNIVAIDAMDTGLENPLRYVNGCKSLEQQQRVNLKMLQRGREIRFRTTRQVLAGDEFLIEYGIRYWVGRPFCDKVVALNLKVRSLEEKIARASSKQSQRLEKQLEKICCDQILVATDAQLTIAQAEVIGYASLGA